MDKLENLPQIHLPNDAGIYSDVISDKQQAFHLSDAKFRWMAGGVGAGKTVACCCEVIYESWRHGDNYGFILRKTGPEIRRTVRNDMNKLLPFWMIVEDIRGDDGHTDVINHFGYRWAAENNCIPDRRDGESLLRRKRRTLQRVCPEFGGLSRIQYVSWEATLQGEGKFASANIGWYFMEQAEYASKHIYDSLNQRLRRLNTGRTAWFSTNPKGHDWLWKIFSPESRERLPDHEMFHVETTDNEGLPPDYIATLKTTYSPEDYERWVKGRFDVANDAIFPEFNEKTHVLANHVEPHPTWMKGLGLDPGLTNPTGAVCIAALPTGELYVYDEYYEKDKIVSYHAAQLNPKLTRQHVWRIIDPAAWRSSDIDRNTTANEYLKHGIAFAAGSKDVQAGLNLIKEYLAFEPLRRNPFTGGTGSPRMFFSPNCRILADQMLSYRKEPLKTGIGDSNELEKPHKYYDHLIDAMRYLVSRMALPANPESRPDGKTARMNQLWPNIPAHQNMRVIDEAGNTEVHIGDLIKRSEQPIREGQQPTSWYNTW